VCLLLEEPAFLPRVGRFPGPRVSAILRLQAFNQLRLSLPPSKPGSQQLCTHALRLGLPSFPLNALVKLLLRLAPRMSPLRILSRYLIVKSQGLNQQPRPFNTRPEFRGGFVLVFVCWQILQSLLYPATDLGHFAVFISWFRHR